jgi:exodeoxyribonuclease VII small subunit
MSDQPRANRAAPASERTVPTEPAAPAGNAVPPALAELSYERARAELASVVERLEAGGCTLEEALALWERGEALADVCQRRLDGARARLDRTPKPST